MIRELQTVNDLRTILSEEIVKLREGTTTAASVNAIVNATGKILSTVKLEIEYNKLVGKMPDIPFIPVSRKKLNSPTEAKKANGPAEV